MESTLSTIHYRALQEEDVQQIKSIFEEAYPIRYPQAFYESLKIGWFEQNSLYSYVAEIIDQKTNESKIIGAIICQYRPTTFTDVYSYIRCSYQFEDIFYIMNIAVIPEYKHLHIGSELIHQIISIPKCKTTCAGIFLHVLESNEEAIHFYNKNGFRKLACIRNFYYIQGQYKSSYLYCQLINNAEPITAWDTLYYFKWLFSDS
ncbi:hypothetical protein WA158_000926 [Blastocystis sp. Blastoise]